MDTREALLSHGEPQRARSSRRLRAALSVTLLLGAVAACGGDDEPEGQATAGKGAAGASGKTGADAGGKSGAGSSAEGGAGAAVGASGGVAGGGGDEGGQIGGQTGEAGQVGAGGEGGQAGVTLVSIEVTPEGGGSLTLGDTTVDIPPGAVAETVTITLELVDLSTLAPLPAGAHAISLPVALKPHGIAFAVPVTITLGHDGGSGGERAVLRLDDEADESWAAIAEPTFTATDVSFETSTFSVTIVVDITVAVPGDVIALHQVVSAEGSVDNAAPVVFNHQDQLFVGSRIAVIGQLADAIVTQLVPGPEPEPRLGWTQGWWNRVTSAPSPTNMNRDDYVEALAVDELDNVLVAGSTMGVLASPNSAGAFDAYVRKVDKYGTPLWTRQWGGVSKDQFANAHNDTARDVAVDDAGNVFVTGALDFQGSIWIADAYVRKLTADGDFDPDNTPTWQYIFTPEAATHDYGVAVAVDPNNDVFVLGTTEGDVVEGKHAGKTDYFVSKRNGVTGEEAWTRQYGTAEIDCAQALATDSSGDVFVGGQTGTCTDGAYPGLAGFVVKLDGANGDLVWKHDITTPTGEQRVTALAIDADDNVLVAGHSTGSFDTTKNVNAGATDAFVRKLNNNGTPLWTNLFGNPRTQRAYGVAVDSSGLVAVVGSTQGDLENTLPSNTFQSFVAWLVP